MDHRARVTLAWAHAKFHKLGAQRRTVVLGVLTQALFRKLFELANLLCEVIDAQIAPIFRDINLIASGIEGFCPLLDRLRGASSVRRILPFRHLATCSHADLKGVRSGNFVNAAINASAEKGLSRKAMQPISVARCLADSA